jgi:hypothetical protein
MRINLTEQLVLFDHIKSLNDKQLTELIKILNNEYKRRKCKK